MNPDNKKFVAEKKRGLEKYTEKINQSRNIDAASQGLRDVKSKIFKVEASLGEIRSKLNSESKLPFAKAILRKGAKVEINTLKQEWPRLRSELIRDLAILKKMIGEDENVMGHMDISQDIEEQSNKLGEISEGILQLEKESLGIGRTEEHNIETQAAWARREI